MLQFFTCFLWITYRVNGIINSEYLGTRKNESQSANEKIKYFFDFIELAWVTLGDNRRLS